VASRAGRRGGDPVGDRPVRRHQLRRRQRTGEVGIRRALGASRGAVVGLVLRETARVVCLEVVIGAVLSWFARQPLGAFLFGVSAHGLVISGLADAAVARVNGGPWRALSRR